MKKRVVMTLMTGMLILMIGGCSQDGDSSGEAETENLDKESSGEEYLISIDDIDWTVKEGTIRGESAIIFEYTNNTPYTIAKMEMTFEQRDDVTSDQLTVFDQYKTDYGWTYEELADTYIVGYNYKFADPGETVSKSPCLINFNVFYPVETMAQYELMEPTKVEITYIGDDDRGYTVMYDFGTEDYDYYYETGRDIHEWTTGDIGNQLPDTEFRMVTVNADVDNYFSFDAYGVSEADYEAYEDACKEIGFTDVDWDDDESYRASNNSGYTLSMDYDFVDEDLYVQISREQPEEESGETDDTSNESSAVDSDVIRPEFQTAMDSYEAFFDEYVAFMQEYNNSDDVTSMLTDYTNYMNQYTDTMSKMEALDDGTLSDAELAYYTEVMNRVTQKLLEV